MKMRVEERQQAARRDRINAEEGQRQKQGTWLGVKGLCCRKRRGGGQPAAAGSRAGLESGSSATDGAHLR